MRGASQVLSDCPHCKVEAALVELIEPSLRVGVALEGRCRLCGYTTELGEVTQLGRPFYVEAEVIEALGRWAVEEGEGDVVLFAQANFNGRTPSIIARGVLAGERIDTGFDVIAWLFPALQGGGRGIEDEERPRQRVGEAAPRPEREPVVAVRRTVTWDGDPGVPTADPRDIGRALASIMLADGVIHPAERRFLEVVMAKLGAPPLAETDLRVWRPTEIGPVADPKALLDAMRRLALCDGEADDSERRVILEFARAWRLAVPADPLPDPRPLPRLWRGLSRLVVH